MHRTSTRATNNNVILRRSRAIARDRLEGWKHTRSLWPSFETGARQRERSPQDDAELVSGALSSGVRSTRRNTRGVRPLLRPTLLNLRHTVDNGAKQLPVLSDEPPHLHLLDRRVVVGTGVDGDARQQHVEFEVLQACRL